MSEKEPAVKKEDLITKTHAAKLLGTSINAVGRWITAGVLDTHRDRQNVKVYKTQVMEIVDIRKHEHKPRRLQDEVTFLKYQVKKLDRLLRNVLLVVELPHKIMVFTDKELMYWYDEAKRVNSLQIPEFKESDLEKWFNLLSNLHEEEFKRLKHLLGDPASWVPFALLCDNVINIAKHNYRRFRKGRTAQVCAGWVDVYMMLRAQLRRKGIEIEMEEPHNYGAAKRADMLLDYAHREAHPIELRAKKREGGSD